MIMQSKSAAIIFCPMKAGKNKSHMKGRQSSFLVVGATRRACTQVTSLPVACGQPAATT